MNQLLNYFRENPQMSMALILAAVGLATLAVFLFIRLMMERRQKPAKTGTGSGTDGAESMLVMQLPPAPAGGPPPEGVATRVDQGFARTIYGTGLALSPEQAVGLIFLAGLAIAIPLYIWRGDLWLVTLGFFIGIIVPFGIFMYLSSRRRMMIQDQPAGRLLLSGPLLAGGPESRTSGRAGGQRRTQAARRRTQTLRPPHEPGPGDSGGPATHRQTDRAGRLRRLRLGGVATPANRRQPGAAAGPVGDQHPRPQPIPRLLPLGHRPGPARREFFLGLAAPLILLGYALFRPDSFALFFSNPLGLTLIAIAAALEIIGILWLWGMLKMSY